MIALDSNVLIRYIAQDDPVQSPQATAIIDSALSRQECIFIPVVVLCETVWVLRGYYKLSKQKIVQVLEALTAEKGFEIEACPEIMRALADYRKNSGDFADYVIGHISRRSGCTAVYTFDNKLKRSSLFHAVKKS